MTSPMDHLTMAEKVWNNHIVLKGDNGEPDLIYIDLQLLHEVTSPQAFDGLRLAGRALRRPTSPWPQKTTTSPLKVSKLVPSRRLMTSFPAPKWKPCAKMLKNLVSVSIPWAMLNRVLCMLSARNWG